jgi:hypothetical protein
MPKQKPRPVYDRQGVIRGYVSKQSTSVGASKLLGRPVEFSLRPVPCWVESAPYRRGL